MSKKWMAALAVPVLAVTGVGVASAQTADDDVSTDDDTTDAAEHQHRGRRGGRGVGRIAEAIGIEPQTLKDAVDAGQTIAEVAADNGVDIDSVIADMVSAAQTRADEAGRDDFDADALTERLTAVVNGEVDLSERGGRRGPGRGLRGSSEAVETLLGLEVQEIKAALQAGQTLAEVAEEQGVSLDDLVSTIVSDIETRIAESDRELPEDFNTEDLTDRVTDRVTSERPERPERGRRGPAGPGGFNGGGPEVAEATAA